MAVNLAAAPRVARRAERSAEPRVEARVAWKAAHWGDPREVARAAWKAAATAAGVTAAEHPP